MIRIHNVKIPLEYTAQDLLSSAAHVLNISSKQIESAQISHRSIDARKKNAICFVVSLDLVLKQQSMESQISKRLSPQIGTLLSAPPVSPIRPLNHSVPRPVVIGFGPSGLFCALILAQSGLRPIVLERGRDVDSRTADVENYFSNGAPAFSPVSNVQFGEGGAGTFSDGKLNSGIKDGHVKTVLETFVRFGAPSDILIDQKPHIGTDKLKNVVKQMRNHIIALGGEVHFESKAVSFSSSMNKLQSVAYQHNGATYELPCECAVLCIGHSARDTFQMLQKSGFSLLPKPFSMGVRIEHPQRMITESQYGPFAGHPALGAADYKLAVHLSSGRSVYTFCMCPGGSVIAAASEPDTVVTNGMSVYARNGENANSALLVGIDPVDFPGNDPLSGMYWQREFEQKAFLLGGSNGCAPCQTVGDFLGRPLSGPSVTPSYRPGVSWCNLEALYPALFTDALHEALPLMGHRLHGFDLPGAVLTAPETRSSSPVRIPRGPDLQSPFLSGIYPCGEGAGYAGGITSAAVDGIRCAEAILERYLS